MLFTLLVGTTLPPAVYTQQAQLVKKSISVRSIFTSPDSSPSQPLPQGTLSRLTAPGAPYSQLADEMVAVVNTDVVTRRGLLDRTNLVGRTFRVQNRPLPPRTDLPGGVFEQFILGRA